MKVKVSLALQLGVAAASLTMVSKLLADAPLFSDNFNSGASAQWGNNVGSWVASGGVYEATLPNNNPQAYSALPFDVQNFTLDVDINGVADGGIWLRSTQRPGTAVGISGVLLVLRGGDTYWHTSTDGVTLSAAQGYIAAPYAAGSNPHVHVVVSGNTYQAFINGAATPATSITTSAFSDGLVALYSNSNESFDNFSLTLVPEPSSALLLGLGSLCMIGWLRKGRVGCQATY